MLAAENMFNWIRKEQAAIGVEEGEKELVLNLK